MKKILVIGGGLSGVSSSVLLSKNNFQVTLLEASPKLGGRAYSLKQEGFKSQVDNGQHIMLGCYKATLKYLKSIGKIKSLISSDYLSIPFVTNDGKQFELKTKNKLYPFNLIIGLLSYKALTIKDRFKVINFLFKANRIDNNKLLNMSVDQLFSECGQDELIQKFLWDIILVGTMNSTADLVSAKSFLIVLNKIFLGGNSAHKFILPKTSLSNLFYDGVEEIIKDNGGEICLGEKVENLICVGNSIVGVETNKRKITDFDKVVIAIPPYSLNKLTDKINIPKFNYSSILNIHIELFNNIFSEQYYSLIDSDIHWIFNHGSHISLTTSSAERYLNVGNEDIKKLVITELKNYFPEFNEDEILKILIIKEKRATFIPSIETEIERKQIDKYYENLELAGDWTNTSLPSTIESAILSGQNACSKIIQSYKN